MAKQIVTEIRITHKSLEDKTEYEKKLDEALKENGYSNRIEFIKEKIRELVNKNKNVEVIK